MSKRMGGGIGEEKGKGEEKIEVGVSTGERKGRVKRKRCGRDKTGGHLKEGLRRWGELRRRGGEEKMG